MKRAYRPDPTTQRIRSHDRRKLLGRVKHQIRGMQRPWMNAWRKFQAGRGPKPGRIKLPYAAKQHKRMLWRMVMQATQR